MGTSFARNRLLGAALLLSLLLHGSGALMVPEMAHVDAAVPVEIVSFTKVKRVEITHRAAPAARKSAPVTIARRFRPSAQPKPALHLTRSALATPPREATLNAAPARTVARGPATASLRPEPTPHATASADAREVAKQTVRQVAGGFMPFGSENAPVLDPDARKQLEGLAVHVTLHVVVTDDGRTKSVSFDPPLDRALEAQIQTLLAAANWDPGYCGGGIPCESQTTITL